MASFVSKNSSKNLTLAAPATTFLKEVNALTGTEFGELPLGVVLPYGMVHFKVKCPTNAQEATLSLYLPKAGTASGFLNYGPTADNPEPHFYSFLLEDELGAVIGLNPITLYVKDGGWGDNDLTENGVIELICGPTKAVVPEMSAESDEDTQRPGFLNGTTEVKDWMVYE